MAISDRINEMYTHVGEVYDTITNVDLPTNKNIENIPSTIRKSYLDIMNNGIDTIYDNWEKVNGTGTSISLNNTEEAPMTIEYKGNTSQFTTTGKNLFIPKPNNSTSAGITYSLNEDGTINLSGTSTNVIYFTFDKNVSESNFVNGNTYTFSSNKTIPSGVVYKIEIRTATSWLREYAISNSTPTRTFTIDLTDAVLIRYDIQVNNGTTPNLTNVGIQIEAGSSVTSFEPYTNGASPNPNYPQDIHIVSGDNYINVCGKNLLYNSFHQTSANGIKCELLNFPSGTFTWSFTNQNIPGEIQVKTKVNGSYQTYANAYSTNKLTFTLNSPQDIQLESYRAGGNPLENYSNIMIERGSTASTYEAYKGASYEINLGEIELCKIGTYKDRIFKSSGKNLFDKNTITSGYRLDGSGIANGSASNEFTSDFIEVESGKTYIRNYGDISAYTRTCFYDKNKSFVSKNDDSQSFTIPDNVKYIRFSEYLSRLDTMQFEKGTTATTYEPYGKDWYLNKQIGKFTYNNEGSVSTPKTNYYNISGLTNQGWINTLGTKTYLSNEYPSSNVQNTDANFQSDTANMDYAFDIHTNGTGLRFKDSRGLSANDFKTDLIGTEIYFALATPTYEKITGELLNQLEAIKKSYENQTNINQENNDLPFELEVGALEKY